MRLAWLTDIHLNFLSRMPRGLPWAVDRAVRCRGCQRRHRREPQRRGLIAGNGGRSQEADLLRPRQPRLLQRIGCRDAGKGRQPGPPVREPRLPHPGGRGRAYALYGLVGHDGWADARLGDYERSQVQLNDFVLIEELARYMPIRPTSWSD